MKNMNFFLISVLSLGLFNCTSSLKNERFVAGHAQVLNIEIYNKFGSGNKEKTKIYLLDDRQCQTFTETYRSGTAKTIEQETNATQCELLQESYQEIVQNKSCENRNNVLSQETSSGNTSISTLKLNSQCQCFQEDYSYRSGTSETIRTLVPKETCNFSK